MTTDQALTTAGEGVEPLLRPVMPELDSLRGLAILMVILYHGLYWQVDLPSYHGAVRFFLKLMWAGRLGVNLFFVLSGFLITGLLIESLGRSDYYLRFYIRRALRILPAYLVILAILAAIRYAPISFILLSLVYLSNLTPLFGIPIAYPVLWSLAVEEHFYFLWPAVVRRARSKSLIFVCAVVIIGTPTLRLISFFIAAKRGVVSFVVNDYTWNSLDGLACGAMLSAALREYKPARETLFKVSLLLLGIAIVMGAVGIPLGILSRQVPMGMALQVVPFQFTFTALLCMSLLAGSSAWKSAVNSRILQFLGKISYGLYLLHLLVFDFYTHFIGVFWKDGANTSHFLPLITRLVVCAVASTGIAFLSREYFEEPFLRLKNKIS
jgi:peptidoglycan/LPS O-acetylase OafA/YrhL